MQKKQLFISIFSHVSRVLRKTPLKRVGWLGNLHNRLYGKLSRSHVFDLGGFVVELDQRDRTIAKNLELYGKYEEYIRSVMLSLAQPGTTVVDVGANVGLHAIPLAMSLGKGGQVIAFEPDPDNYALLCKNVKRNKISNIRLENTGLSSEAGTALLYQSVENRGSLSLCKENVDGGDQKEISPVEITLKVADDLFQDISPPVSLVKIDVEGAEPLVVQGMWNTLERNPDAKLIFEFWPRFIEQFSLDSLQFLKALEAHGFVLSVIDEANRKIDPSTSENIVAKANSSNAALNLIARR